MDAICLSPLRMAAEDTPLAAAILGALALGMICCPAESGSRFTFASRFRAAPPARQVGSLARCPCGQFLVDLLSACNARCAIAFAPSRTNFLSSNGCSTLSWLKDAWIPFESKSVCKIALCSSTTSLLATFASAVGRLVIARITSVVSVWLSASCSVEPSFLNNPWYLLFSACTSVGSKSGGTGGTSKRSARSLHLKNWRCLGSQSTFCDKKCL
mmetsp:Transcript_44268/g.122554  ORF Transcript_44268/g.122554 Transcript_44268/m.122554 type:complete len:214 (+) Transcript_44268:593-1234(+)